MIKNKRSAVLYLVLLVFLTISFFVQATANQAFAEAIDTAKSNVQASGEEIVEGNTYFLEWTGLSVEYNGEIQSPIAVLKCEEDTDFEKTTTVTIQGNASGVSDAGNYVAIAACDGVTFTSGNTQSFVIAKKSVAVEWQNGEYTYNNTLQGPSAKYKDINGEEQDLDASGLATDAGTYTASVLANAAGNNYELTNTTCNYTIAKLSASILWVDFKFTANGEVQMPRAYAAGLNGEIVELPVNASGVKAGKHVAELDAEKIDANFNLEGEWSFEYTILPEAEFGVTGTILSIVLGVFFVGAVGCAVLLFFENKKKIEKLENSKNTEIEQLHQEVKKLKGQLGKLKKNEYELRNKLDAEQKEKNATNEALQEEIAKLQENANVRFVDHGNPIEMYLGEIESTLHEALEEKFDPQNGEIYHISQRHHLERVIRTINMYKDQRR